MGLNIVKAGSQMYQFIDATWNTVKGECPHGCEYCYMKRWGKLPPVRFDEKELKTDLGEGNFIFVGSSCDMFASDIPSEWIIETLLHCKKHNENKYLFQTKNPQAFTDYAVSICGINEFVLCTTIETNRHYPDIMKSSPAPKERAHAMAQVSQFSIPTYITIEPIMDFDMDEMLTLIRQCKPTQVNIGADSGNNNLPEPSYEKVMELIDELNKFTVVANKKNLYRLLK